MSMQFDNSYTQLPDRFFARQNPVPVKSPSLIRVNGALAKQLNIDPAWLESIDGVSAIAGNLIPDGADPIATVYAGHQFGSWNPQLGDGRAVLLGEIIAVDGERYDLQLKGSGQTPYSRMGDGRAPLGPVLREYVISEAMAALGISTSRTLAAVATGETVFREEALPGAVLARIAKSHIRIGTVQFFGSQNDVEGLKLLVEHVIGRHYPDVADAEFPAAALLDKVMEAQAKLVASWQMVGFIHGVMNTDNVLLSGETIDYGPCAFMDTYDPAAVFSSIDHGGRYAYRNQPGIANWNIACLAQSLLPLLADTEEKAIETGKELLEQFPGYFLEANISGLRSKLGLSNSGQDNKEDDEVLTKDFLDLLEANQCDFTLAFRRLSEIAGEPPTDSVSPLFEFPETFNEWLARWQTRCSADENPDRQSDMLNTNPAVIPRNHLVEEAIAKATYEDDLSAFHQLVDHTAKPFESATDLKYATPPTSEQVVAQTFCGT